MFLILLPCLIFSNNCTLVPEMDWLSSHYTDVIRMEKLVQIVALPETRTVLGMEMHVPDIHQHLKGKENCP